MKIDPAAAAGLVAVIKNDLRAIDEINRRLDEIAAERIAERDAATVAYGLHNIYSAFENSFEQISRTFENHLVDPSRWHRELLSKMFLDIPAVRQAVLSESSRTLAQELLRFRHLFRHNYDFRLDIRRLEALLANWRSSRHSPVADLHRFAESLTQGNGGQRLGAPGVGGT